MRTARTRRPGLAGLTGLVAGLALALGACGSRTPTSTLPTAPVVPTDDIAAPAPGRGGSVATPDGDEGGLAAKDPRIVDLDIIRIRGTSTGVGGEPEASSVATADLFRAAHEAAKAGNTKEAIGRFRQLVADFPDSLYAPVALFNIAAIYDGQGDMVSTITTLRELVDSYPQSRESIDGHLYIAALQSDKQQWSDAAKTLTEVLARAGLTSADRVEAYARAGYVALEQKQFAEADSALEAAQAEWRRAPRIDDPYYIAMAYYYRGELVHQKFEAIVPRLPDTQLIADMEQKRALAVQAYDRWKEALAFRHAYWATASGYQMSQIYVELWEATVKAPLPTQLTGTAKTAYVNQVHDNMHDHLVKALEGHQQNIELAKAFGVDTTWSKASETRAVQVMELLAQEAKRPTK